MIKKLLIANRGEIACRIMRTARRMEISTFAVYSEADANAMHVRHADQAFLIGPAPANQSYLNIEAILGAAKNGQVDAIHPGYGFLAENAEFAQAVRDAGFIFVGPPTQAIRDMGAKDNAKKIMEGAGVPIVPGYYGTEQSVDYLRQQASDMGYPLMLKAALGGGGKGMRIVTSENDLEASIASAKREALSSFGDDRLLIERYLTNTRHIEMQIFADEHGNAVHLFERDCSLQRRHQKVIEEAPAPGMTQELRQKMGDAAVAAALAVNYQGAGTVEFLLTPDHHFYFMEMNTRLQVEHSVSELITGQDFVEWQLRIASGEPLALQQSELSISGHAIEARIYAEDPHNDFLPSPGTVEHLVWPEESPEIRVDTGVEAGDVVSPHYDPMIAKITSHGKTRSDAINLLEQSLRQTEIIGPGENIGFLNHLLNLDRFVDGTMDTSFVDELSITASFLSQSELNASLAACAQSLFQAQSDNAMARARGSDDPFSPWWENDSWRLSETRHRSVDLIYKNQSYHVQETKTGFQVDERVVETTELADMRVIRHENIWSVFGALAPVSIIEFDPAESQLYGDLIGGTFLAPMPGKITSVNVCEGDAVEAGDVLVVLEAMKMEHAISADCNGVVTQLFVEPGLQVDDGYLLLTLEPAT